MVLVSYDISNDKKRNRFNKYIRKFGHKLQFSVYEIDNSERILKNIIVDIENKFIKEFDETDSVYIFQMSEGCKVHKYGFTSHEDDGLLIC